MIETRTISGGSRVAEGLSCVLSLASPAGYHNAANPAMRGGIGRFFIDSNQEGMTMAERKEHTTRAWHGDWFGQVEGDGSTVVLEGPNGERKRVILHRINSQNLIDDEGLPYGVWYFFHCRWEEMPVSDSERRIVHGLFSNQFPVNDGTWDYVRVTYHDHPIPSPQETGDC